MSYFILEYNLEYTAIILTLQWGTSPASFVCNSTEGCKWPFYTFAFSKWSHESHSSHPTHYRGEKYLCIKKNYNETITPHQWISPPFRTKNFQHLSQNHIASTDARYCGHHNHTFKYHTGFFNTCGAKCVKLNIYTWQERGTVHKKNLYAHILYIWKCISMPWRPPPHSLRPLSPSPAPSHVGGSTGHAAMPHQYANWWNTSPAFPCAIVSEARSGSSS